MGRVVSIDHLIFGVSDLQAIFKILGNLLDITHLTTLRISKSNVSMFQFGDKLPLIGFGSAPVGGDKLMSPFLNEKGEGFHHLGLQVDNLASFEENLIKNDISFRPWEPDGSNIVREILTIDTENWPTPLHITNREGTDPMTPEAWVDRQKAYGVNMEKTISYERSRWKTPCILRIDHIAFAVKDLRRTIRFVEDVLGGRYLFEFNLSKTIIVAFVQLGETIVSLEYEPMDGDGFVAKFLRKKGGGLHHIGLQVDDIDRFKEIMTANGIPVPPWDLEGDKTQREEVLIGTKYFSTVLQIVDWKGNPPTTPQEWVDREKEFLE